MFGYVIANKDQLTPEQQERYRSYYCGLCHALKDRFGSMKRLSLTYDMAFLILLLSSLYEPETATEELRCGVHPLKAHKVRRNEITEYGADLNLYLAYYNCLDDLQDDGSLKGRLGAALFKGPIPEIEARWPRQCAAVRQHLAAMSALEQGAGNGAAGGRPEGGATNPEGAARTSGASNPNGAASPAQLADAMANRFGALMGELFLWKEDRWAPGLRRLGEGLGRFIYLADAYEDLEKDRKKGAYNPLLALYGDGEDCFRQGEELLTLFLAEAAAELEKLPLEQDLDLLRNILYSGVWARINGAKLRRETAAKKAAKART
ncbi:MAG: hypothetical protein IJC68_03710 [Firmicutes bacterium]|nr:hypothetical protein [Bacillota bacterium]